MGYLIFYHHNKRHNITILWIGNHSKKPLPFDVFLLMFKNKQKVRRDGNLFLFLYKLTSSQRETKTNIPYTKNLRGKPDGEQN